MPKIDYLRISLIDKCNFRCQYCMPEEAELNYVLNDELLSDREIISLVRDVFIPLGFTKFRLTGGEPLLRRGIVDIVREIAGFSATEDIALTTNAFLLEKLAQPLYEAGLKRINISLDSLIPETFDQITGTKGKSRWQQTWRGILAAHQTGFDPLKLNVVVIPGINDSEVLDLAALSIDRRWHVRFIEFMPIGNSQLFGDKAWIDSEDIRNQLRQKWGLAESFITGNGPADVFKIPGSKGTVGFISQMSECFCDRCNRVRLSADGWLRPCLLNETGQIDLKTALRQGVEMTELQNQINQLLLLKPEINFKDRDSGTNGIYTRTMSQIGG